KEEFAVSAESFWIENPQHLKPAPKLKQQQAYNKAIKRPQLWLDNFLVQEGGLEFDQDFICYWLQGGKGKAADLAETLKEQLQSVYSSHPDVEIPGLEGRTEPLSKAQQPPLSWKPDNR